MFKCLFHSIFERNFLKRESSKRVFCNPNWTGHYFFYDSLGTMHIFLSSFGLKNLFDHKLLIKNLNLCKCYKVNKIKLLNISRFRKEKGLKNPCKLAFTLKITWTILILDTHSGMSVYIILVMYQKHNQFHRRNWFQKEL